MEKINNNQYIVETFDNVKLNYLDLKDEKGCIFIDKSILKSTIKKNFTSLISDSDLIYSTKKANFYYYLSEGVDDLNWGCAWRCIQTLLSSLILNDYEHLKKDFKTFEIIKFKNLFYSYGSKKTLTELYNLSIEMDKETSLPEFFNGKLFAPFENKNHWAEPFISYLIINNFCSNKASSELVLINGYPSTAYAPEEVFHRRIGIQEFFCLLLNHFMSEDNFSFPVIIDNSICTYCIVGVVLKDFESNIDYENKADDIDDCSIRLIFADPHVGRNENPEDYLYCLRFSQDGYLLNSEEELKYTKFSMIDFSENSYWMAHFIYN